MTQEEFNQMLLIGLGQVGIGNAGANVENPDEVETVTTVEGTTTLPMAKHSGGSVIGYVQIKVSDLITQVAGSVGTSANLQTLLAASDVIDDAQYNSQNNHIELLHGNTVVAYIDAADIFNAANYYNKTQADAGFVESIDEDDLYAIFYQ